MPVLQNYPEPPFTEWEYKLYLDLLHLPMSMFDHIQPRYDSAVQFKRKLTINHFRKQIPGVTPHPDDRGDKFVYEGAEEREGDGVIPPEQLIGAWNKLIEDRDGMEQNRPPFSFFKDAYPELYTAAKAVGSPEMLSDYPTKGIVYDEPDAFQELLEPQKEN